MAEQALSVTNLHKQYGSVKAVNGLSFDVNKGEVFGILGPNGSGKTTTLSILTAIVNPNRGYWTWFGKDKRHNVRTRIGVLLEKPNFFGYLSAVDNLKIVADIRGVSYSEIDEVLKRVGLYDRKNSRFKTYSLGMKQRLAIGSVLLGNPEVLILDEPTNGLDPQGIAEVRELIIELSKEGSTIIIASHLLDEIQKVCTDVLVMKHGNKLYQGKVNHLLGKVSKILIQSDDQVVLKELILTHPRVKGVVETGDKLLVDLDADSTSIEINKFLFDHKIILSHLSYESISLEEKILSLLNGEAHEAN